MNSELARAFERIADLLEISGGDPFRINSYRRVGRIVKDLNDDIRVLHDAGVIREIKGIGKATAAKIEEFLATGTIAMLDELEQEAPPGLPALLAIPGLGPKKIALMRAELGVRGMDDLKAAIASGKLETLAGFGKQSVARIADGISFIESSGDRTPRGVALPIAESLAAYVAALPGVSQVEIAGSLRRGAETAGDVDLLCSAADGEPVVRAFTEHESVERVLASGKTKGSVRVPLGEGRELQVDLRVVPAESFGAALQYFTGSKEHNVRVREIASARKLKLSEWGLFDGETMVAGDSEAGIYEALDLPVVPPELREDRGELESETRFDELVTAGDIRGDLHMHTNASDGKNTIEEMATAARDRGYAYIAITDHSKSSTIANGLSIERMRSHMAAIREVNERLDGIEVLVGCECDILPDGSLDYPDEILAQCDVVVASIHAAMGKGGSAGKLSPTDRTLRAIESPYVSIIGHPTGRLINRRPAMELDMAVVIAAAKESGTALEVNASWQRLDLRDAHIRQAVEAGVMLSIDTDAHSTGGLAAIRDGISTARRGAATRACIINTWPADKLRGWLARKRS